VIEEFSAQFVTGEGGSLSSPDAQAMPDEELGQEKVTKYGNAAEDGSGGAEGGGGSGDAAPQGDSGGAKKEGGSADAASTSSEG